MIHRAPQEKTESQQQDIVDEREDSRENGLRTGKVSPYLSGEIPLPLLEAPELRPLPFPQSREISEFSGLPDAAAQNRWLPTRFFRKLSGDMLQVPEVEEQEGGGVQAVTPEALASAVGFR